MPRASAWVLARLPAPSHQVSLGRLPAEWTGLWEVHPVGSSGHRGGVWSLTRSLGETRGISLRREVRGDAVACVPIGP